MSKKIKIGMIGGGFIGQLAHLANYVENDLCVVEALADLRPNLRERVAARFEIPLTYSSHHELLLNPEIDAVCVVTPRQYTAPTVLDCLKANKHVLSEKPMAGNYKQASQLAAVAKEKNLTYSIGYMKRYDEGVERAKKILDEAIQSSELGELIYARAHCFCGDSYCNPLGHVTTDEKPTYSDRGWPMTPDWLPLELENYYHVYLNTYSHNINLLRYLVGKSPEIISSKVSRENGQVVVLDFGSFLGVLETGIASNHDWDEVAEFFFTNGRISIHTPPALLRNFPAKVTVYKGSEIMETHNIESSWSWSFKRQADAFVDSLITGNKTKTSGADSLEDMRLIEEIWRMDQGLS